MILCSECFLLWLIFLLFVGVCQKKTSRVNTFLRKVTHARKRNPWAYRDELLHSHYRISMTLVCFSHVSSACITLMFIICLILIAVFCHACYAVCEYKYTVFQKKRDHVFDDKDELELPFITIFAVRCYAYCRHPVSVRPSDTFVSCAKMNKDIFEIFSPSGSHTILVFPY